MARDRVDSMAPFEEEHIVKYCEGRVGLKDGLSESTSDAVDGVETCRRGPVQRGSPLGMVMRLTSP